MTTKILVHWLVQRNHFYRTTTPFISVVIILIKISYLNRICVFEFKMRLVILDTPKSVGEWAAKYVMKRINDFQPGPNKFEIYQFLLFCLARSFFCFVYLMFLCCCCCRLFVLGLPTGSTPLGMYRHLIEYHRQGKISFKYVKTFNMDEYVGQYVTAIDISVASTFNLKLLSLNTKQINFSQKLLE